MTYCGEKENAGLTVTGSTCWKSTCRNGTSNVSVKMEKNAYSNCTKRMSAICNL